MVQRKDLSFSMGWKLCFSPQAWGQYLELREKDQKLIHIVEDQITNDRYRRYHSKHIINSKPPMFRIRAGRWRIIYSLLEEEILIISIKFRNEDTY